MDAAWLRKFCTRNRVMISIVFGSPYTVNCRLVMERRDRQVSYYFPAGIIKKETAFKAFILNALHQLNEKEHGRKVAIFMSEEKYIIRQLVIHFERKYNVKIYAEIDVKLHELRIKMKKEEAFVCRYIPLEQIYNQKDLDVFITNYLLIMYDELMKIIDEL